MADDEEDVIFVDIVPRLDESALSKATDKVEDEFKDTGKAVEGSLKGASKSMFDELRKGAKGWGQTVAQEIKTTGIAEQFSRVGDVVYNTTNAINNLGTVFGKNYDNIARQGDATAKKLDGIGAAAQRAGGAITDAFGALKAGDVGKGISGAADALRSIGQSGAAGSLDQVAKKAEEAQIEAGKLKANIEGTTTGLMTLTNNSGKIAGGLGQITAAAGPLAGVFATLDSLMPGFHQHLSSIIDQLKGLKSFNPKDWVNVLTPGTNLIDQLPIRPNSPRGGSNLPTNPDGTPRPGLQIPGQLPNTVGGIPRPGLQVPAPAPPAAPRGPGIGSSLGPFINTPRPKVAPQAPWGGGATPAPATPPPLPMPPTATPGGFGSSGAGSGGGGAGGGYGLPRGTNISYGAPGFPDWVYQLAAQFGVRASTYAGHQEGAGVNQGIDWSGSTDALQRFAEALVSAKPPGLEQVIWSNPNTGRVLGLTPSGQTVTDRGGYYRDDWGGHTDHVHTRFSQNPLAGSFGPHGGANIGEATPVMVTSFGEQAKGDMQSAMGFGDIGTGLDSDFGVSQGLPGIAKNITGFLANMAFAPAVGALRGIQAGAGGSSGGGSGLLGMLGGLGGGISGLGMGGGSTIASGPGGPLGAASALGIGAGAPGGSTFGPAGLTTPKAIGRQMGEDAPSGGGIGFGGGLIGEGMSMAAQAGGMAVNAMAPGAGGAAAMGAQIGEQMINRTAGYVAQLGGIAAQGVLETLMLSDTPLADPSNTLWGRVAIAVAGARPQIPNMAGMMAGGQQVAGGTQSGPGQQGGPGGQADPNDPNAKNADQRPWVNIENFHNPSGNPSDGKQVGNDMAWAGMNAQAGGAKRGGG
ncbi:hypothetical protein [Mycobacterium asiaticum]|uniref:Uncharacterized protein n=1 Tax=Mycobacterium asiaticum TaxID=1790 RepID=A0A1A3L3Z9_MYCAS|nr:hypothetical protein [Mycobacterium asiaticum]OBJ90901.1 hypothetical protein A5640_02070 [Mycobacterium asiaticum]